MTTVSHPMPSAEARAHALRLEEEGIIGLNPRAELAAIVGTYAAGIGLLVVGVRLAYAGTRDLIGRRP